MTNETTQQELLSPAELEAARASRAQLTEMNHIRAFVTAGRAVFTLVSKRTGNRRTFRVRRGESRPGETRPPLYFVDLLAGPDNTHDYRYLGFTRTLNDGVMTWTLNKHGWGREAAGIVRWFIGCLNSVHGEGPGARAAQFFADCEFWHEGRCGRCGRALTDPESIKAGIGPVCAEAT